MWQIEIHTGVGRGSMTRVPADNAAWRWRGTRQHVRIEYYGRNAYTGKFFSVMEGSECGQRKQPCGAGRGTHGVGAVSSDCGSEHIASNARKSGRAFMLSHGEGSDRRGSLHAKWRGPRRENGVVEQMLRAEECGEDSHVYAQGADGDGILSTEATSDGEDGMSVSEKEMLRREKISKANRGKVPWNKGRNMSEEMKAKISQRTYEAMQRPEVKARMKKANQNRAPHSEEVRKRIREVLRERAQKARIVIAEQSNLILKSMSVSDLEEERLISVHPKALDTIGRLAWRVLHRDFELMHEKWENNTDGFRDAVIVRFEELKKRDEKNRRRRSEASNKKRAARVASNGKVKAAMDAQRKLQQAREKLHSVEKALDKLEELKVVYEDDKDSLALVEQKERQTLALMTKLKEQVSQLHDTMEPLQGYLSPSSLNGSSDMKALNGAVSLNGSGNTVRAVALEPKDLSSVPVLTQVPWKTASER